MENYECIELENVTSSADNEPGSETGNAHPHPHRISVIKFKDDRVMDPARIERLGTELMTLAQDEDSKKLVIDFSNVSFFSSAAVNKLIVLEKRVRARGGQVRLSNLQPEVRDLFHYTKLDSVFKIDAGQAESLERLENDDTPND